MTTEGGGDQAKNDLPELISENIKVNKGEPAKGPPIWKDTINLKPGEEYVVAFQKWLLDVPLP